jgi:hypothetical protein
VLIDATTLLLELGIGPEDLAWAIREDIKEKTGCSASVGMGQYLRFSPPFKVFFFCFYLLLIT